MGETPTDGAVVTTADGQSAVTASKKIKRSAYRTLSVLLFVDWFGRMVNGITTSPFFESIIPDKEAWKALNANLQTLYNKRKEDYSHTNVTTLQKAVNDAKVEADIVADFLEDKYPGDVPVAAAVYMEYSKTSKGARPAPTTAVTGLKSNPLADAVRITWKALEGGGYDYTLYQSTDNGATFTFVSFTSNSIKGITVPTKPGGQYVFYVVASNKLGEGPKSANFRYASVRNDQETV